MLKSAINTLLLAFLCVLFAPTVCCSQVAQMVVLKNGHEISGRIQQESNRTIVFTESGSQLIFPNEKVDFVCETLAEAYWQKVARITATDADKHVELFHWCLKHSMDKQASNQLNLLIEMDVSAVKLEYLYDLLLKQRTATRQAGTAKAVANVANEEKDNAQKGNVQNDNIQLATFEAEISNSLPKIQPTMAELKNTAAKFSPDSIRFYKRKIEPLLVRSCYTAGCHDAKAGPLPLRRVSPNERVPKHMSQRNLHEVVKFVDFESPFKSSFFLAAVEQHGDQDKPVIRRGTKQFENLRQWMVMISSNPFGFHSSIPEVDLAAPAAKPENRLPKKSLPNESTPAFDLPPEIPTLNSEPVRPAVRKDPFDPDVFNRKFGGKK